MGRSAIAAVAVVLCALAGAGCEARLSLGGACVYDSECAAPLSCRLGRCREECLSGRDCPLGSRCLREPTSGLGACRLPDEATCAVTCPDGTDCLGGTCAARCTSDEACLGTACDLGTEHCTEVALTDAGPPRDAGDPDVGVADAPSPDAALDCASCGSGLCGPGETCDPVVAIAEGALFSCLRRASGAVDCAGSDASGSLGDGAITSPGDVRARYAPIAGGLSASALALGWEHGCVLAEGALHCWGRGDFGQIGAAAATEAPVMVLPADATDPLVAVAAGGYHTCVLHDSGAIDCLGRNDVGQLGDGIVHGACQSEIDCTTTPVRVAGIDDAIAIDAYRYDTCAVRAGGALFCWGSDEHGLLGGAAGARSSCPSPGGGGGTVDCSRVPLEIPGLTGVSAVSIAGEHACAVAGGELFCWGQSDHGRLGLPADSLVHLPTRVTLASAPSRVEVGGFHTTVLAVDGHLYAFGLNDDARLGRPAGAPASSATPLEVPALTDVRALASGSFHTCALDGAGVVSCWGLDEQGQLGDGAEGAGSTPAPIVRE